MTDTITDTIPDETRGVNYKPLMAHADETVKVLLDPEEAKRFVTRVRKVRFFIHTSVDLVTEVDENGKATRVYADMSAGAVPVSAANILDMLTNLAKFNARKEKQGQEVGRVEISRFGDCIFI